ncbi:MAG: hypothetical protein M1831_002589 [Alyxoria varia]|nr:MAG: hypothetical protein M1831_002589 [Alyxoria varia]
MGSCVPLLGTTSSLDNLVWSEDCDLAVALTDHVEILVPRLGFSPPSRYELEDTRWHRVRLQVNRFKPEEVPYINPLSFRAFSFGEEQSFSHVVSLAWSPAGVAKHGRCALAILTANHVLSIWAPLGDVRTNRGWKRVLVVNHFFKQFWGGSIDADSPTVNYTPGQNGVSQNEANESSMGEMDDEYSPEETEEEYRRLRSRIRSFCWSPRFPGQAKVHDNRENRIDHQYLAISNDLGEIFVLEIKPSHLRSQSSSSSWSSTIKADRDICNLAHDPIPFDQFNDSPLEATNCALNLSWSSFLHADGVDDKGTASILAYTLGSRLHLAIIRSFVHEQQISMEFSQEKQDFAHEYVGPIAWTYDVEMDAIHLLAFTTEEAHCISLPSAPLRAGAPNVMLSARQRGDCWYPIAGHCFTKRDGTNANCLHFVNSFSTGSLKTQHGQSWPFLETSDTFETTWSEAIMQQRLLFDSEHDIDEKIATRIYGMASSPLGDCIAMCISLHPSELPEHRNSRGQSVQLLLSYENESLEPLLTSLRSMSGLNDPTYEALMFGAQRFLSDAPVENPQAGAAKLKLVLNSKAPKLRPNGTKAVGKRNSRARKEDLLNNLGPRLGGFDGFSRRVIHVFAPEESRDLRRQQDTFDEAVAFRMTSDILALPREDLRWTDLTQSILKLYEKCQELVTPQTRNSRKSKKSTDGKSFEDCIVCGAPLPFTAMNWARCENEHQFSRCSLTFIAIQEPGVSRFCGICDRQYLNEHHLLSVDAGVEGATSTFNTNNGPGTPVDSDQNIMSLVEILVSSLDSPSRGRPCYALVLQKSIKETYCALVSMEKGPSTRTSFGPRRSKGLEDLRISIASSTARQSEQVVPSRTSPAHAITDALVETSQPVGSKNTPRDEDWSTDESAMPEINIEPPPRHPQNTYRRRGKSSTREKSYFEIDSDSSGIDNHQQEGSTTESVSSQSCKAPENVNLLASTDGSIGVAQSGAGAQTGGHSKDVDDVSLDNSGTGENLRLNPEHSMLTRPAFSYGGGPFFQSYPRNNFNSVNPFENTHDHPSLDENQSMLATRHTPDQNPSSQPSEAKNAENTILRASAMGMRGIEHLTRLTLEQLGGNEQKSEPSKSKSQTPRTSNEFGSSRASSIGASRRSNTFLRSGANLPVSATEPGANRVPPSSVHAKRRSLSSPPAPEAPPVPPLPDKLQFAERATLALGSANSYSNNESLRTPYPFPQPSKNGFKNHQETRHILRHAGPPRDLREVSRGDAPHSGSRAGTQTLLTLWVQRRNYPNGRSVAFIAVPTDPELAKPQRPRRDTLTPDEVALGARGDDDGAEMTPPPALDFDDARFFQGLREAYHGELLGKNWIARIGRRWFSALELKRVKFTAGDGHGSFDGADPSPFPWSHALGDIENQQEYPRWVGGNVAGPSTNTFSEDKLMRYFQHPLSEKARYAWVHWIHRVALELDKEESDDAVTATKRKQLKDEKQQRARPTRAPSVFGRRPSQSRSRSRSRSMSLGRKKGKKGDGKGGADGHEQLNNEKHPAFRPHQRHQQQPNGREVDGEASTATPLRKFSQAPFQLQFVEGFSKVRIAIGTLFVLVAAVLTLVLWVALGPDKSSDRSRVAAGAGLGLVTGGIGFLILALWGSLSWLAMS